MSFIPAPNSAPRALFLIAALLLGGCFDPHEQSRLQVAAQGVSGADLSANGQGLVVASIDHGGSFWDVNDAARRFNWNHHGGEASVLVAVALARDGSFAVTVDQVPIMVLWDAGKGQAMRSWMLQHEVTSVALSDLAGRVLIGTSNDEALVFDVRRGGIEHRLAHGGRVRAVAISADGRLGVTVADDRQARVWDLQAAEERHRWPLENNGITAAISASGRYAFAAAQSARAAVWDTQSGALLFELNPFYKWMGRGTTLSSAHFVAGEEELLTGSVVGRVRRWSLPDGKPLASWTLGRRDWLTPSRVKLVALAKRQRGDYLAVGSNGWIYTLSNAPN